MPTVFWKNPFTLRKSYKAKGRLLMKTIFLSADPGRALGFIKAQNGAVGAPLSAIWSEVRKNG